MIIKKVLLALVILFFGNYAWSLEMQKEPTELKLIIGMKWKNFESNNIKFLEGHSSPNNLGYNVKNNILAIGRIFNYKPYVFLLDSKNEIIKKIIRINVSDGKFQNYGYFYVDEKKLYYSNNNYISIYDLELDKPLFGKEKNKPIGIEIIINRYPYGDHRSMRHIARMVSDSNKIYYTAFETWHNNYNEKSKVKLKSLNIKDFSFSNIVFHEEPPYRYFTCKFIHNDKLYYIDYVKGWDCHFSTYDPKTGKIEKTKFAHKILKNKFAKSGVPKIHHFNNTLALSYHDHVYLFDYNTLNLIANIPNKKKFFGKTYFTGYGYMINERIFVTSKAGNGFLNDGKNREYLPDYSFQTKMGGKDELVFYNIKTKEKIYSIDRVTEPDSNFVVIKSDIGYKVYSSRSDKLHIIDIPNSVLEKGLGSE